MWSFKTPTFEPPSIFTIDTDLSLDRFLEELGTIKLNNPNPPPIYITSHFESRGGLRVLAIYIPPLKSIYLISISTLESEAFTRRSKPRAELPECTYSLKTILEADYITKVFFDSGPTKDTLSNRFDIRLRNAIDLQIMEARVNKSLTRMTLPEYVESHSKLPGSVKGSWRRYQTRNQQGMSDRQREADQDIFGPSGRQSVMDQDAADVAMLPSLWKVYDAKSEDSGFLNWPPMARLKAGFRVLKGWRWPGGSKHVFGDSNGEPDLERGGSPVVEDDIGFASSFEEHGDFSGLGEDWRCWNFLEDLIYDIWEHEKAGASRGCYR
ncbi:hypothetical protein FQN54_001059 [Arachnomyces sp. PD_36]|nr:hypothetical protein FQN54_001059 [Arachnomyces sp. PD_36]